MLAKNKKTANFSRIAKIKSKMTFFEKKKKWVKNLEIIGVGFMNETTKANIFLG